VPKRGPAITTCRYEQNHQPHRDNFWTVVTEDAAYVWGWIVAMVWQRKQNMYVAACHQGRAVLLGQVDSEDTAHQVLIHYHQQHQTEQMGHRYDGEGV
jgi:hypothetical protein